MICSTHQLCINLANESLQNFFNAMVFDAELRLYEEEGIDVGTVEFQSNDLCLELILKSKTGIFAILDDNSKDRPPKVRALPCVFVLGLQVKKGRKCVCVVWGGACCCPPVAVVSSGWGVCLLSHH